MLSVSYVLEITMHA